MIMPYRRNLLGRLEKATKAVDAKKQLERIDLTEALMALADAPNDPTARDGEIVLATLQLQTDPEKHYMPRIGQEKLVAPLLTHQKLPIKKNAAITTLVDAYQDWYKLRVVDAGLFAETGPMVVWMVRSEKVADRTPTVFSAFGGMALPPPEPRNSSYDMTVLALGLDKQQQLRFMAAPNYRRGIFTLPGAQGAGEKEVGLWWKMGASYEHIDEVDRDCCFSYLYEFKDMLTRVNALDRWDDQKNIIDAASIQTQLSKRYVQNLEADEIALKRPSAEKFIREWNKLVGKVNAVPEEEIANIAAQLDRQQRVAYAKNLSKAFRQFGKCLPDQKLLAELKKIGGLTATDIRRAVSVKYPDFDLIGQEVSEEQAKTFTYEHCGFGKNHLKQAQTIGLDLVAPEMMRMVEGWNWLKGAEKPSEPNENPFQTVRMHPELSEKRRAKLVQSPVMAGYLFDANVRKLKAPRITTSKNHETGENGRTFFEVRFEDIQYQDLDDMPHSLKMHPTDLGMRFLRVASIHMQPQERQEYEQKVAHIMQLESPEQAASQLLYDFARKRGFWRHIPAERLPTSSKELAQLSETGDAVRELTHIFGIHETSFEPSFYSDRKDWRDYIPVGEKYDFYNRHHLSDYWPSMVALFLIKPMIDQMEQRKRGCL